MYSTDNITWNTTNSAGFEFGFGVATNGSLWIATGFTCDYGSTIQVSTDAVNWTSLSNFDIFVGRCVVWNPIQQLWLLGGYGEYGIIGSQNGYTWEPSLSANQVNGISYGNNMWVNVGPGDSYGSNFTSTIQYSTDGFNWSNATSGGFYDINSNQNNTLPFFNGGCGVAYGNGVWVAVGNISTTSTEYTSTIQWSTDASNWYSASSGGFDVGTGIGVAWSPQQQLWVAVGISSNIYNSIQTSVDGSNWTSIQSGGFEPLEGNYISGGFGVTWTGLEWVAVGAGNYDSNTILRSMDGYNWLSNTYGGFALAGFAVASQLTIQSNIQSLTVQTANIIQSMTFQPTETLMVAVGTDTRGVQYTIQRTADGSNWYPITTGGFNGNYGGNSVAYGNGLWTAVGGSATNYLNTIQNSTDGYNWTPAISGGFNGGGIDVAYGNNQWIAIGYNDGNADATSTIQWSQDGSNWNSAVSGGILSGNGVIYGNGMWVVVGGNYGLSSIQYSIDGSNWSNANTIGNQSVRGIGYGQNLFVVVGVPTESVSSIQYSGDGLNWSNTNSGGFQIGAGIKYSSNMNMWVATGLSSNLNFNGTIQYSGDGSNWSNANTGRIHTMYGYGRVTYSDTLGLWAITGGGGTTTNSIELSSDGSNWVSIQSGGFNGNYGSLGLAAADNISTTTKRYKTTIQSGLISTNTIEASQIQTSMGAISMEMLYNFYNTMMSNRATINDFVINGYTNGPWTVTWTESAGVTSREAYITPVTEYTPTISGLSNGSCTITENGGGFQQYSLHVTVSNIFSSDMASGYISVSCFLAGVLLITRDGPVAVEKLTIGIEMLQPDGTYSKIVELKNGPLTTSDPEEDRRIFADEEEKCIVTFWHKVRFTDETEELKAGNHPRFHEIFRELPVDIYHIRLERPITDKVLVYDTNIIAEGFVPVNPSK